MTAIVTFLLVVVVIQFLLIMFLFSKGEDAHSKRSFFSINQTSKVTTDGASEFEGTFLAAAAAALLDGENGEIASAYDVFGGINNVAMIPSSTLSFGKHLLKAQNYEGVAVTTFLGAPQVRYELHNGNFMRFIFGSLHEKWSTLPPLLLFQHFIWQRWVSSNLYDSSGEKTNMSLRPLQFQNFLYKGRSSLITISVLNFLYHISC